MTKKGHAFSQDTTGEFLLNIKSENHKIYYLSHEGDAIKNQFLYNFDLKKNKISFCVIYGKKPKSWWSLIKLFFYILISKQIYIFYPGGLSTRAGKIARILHKQYGIYVRGNGLYNESFMATKEQKPFNNPDLLKNADFLITVSDELKNNLKPLNKRIWD